MLASQRQDLILREVERAGGTRVSELVDRLGVSDMTIRRDLDALAARGLVLKVHGGATSVRDRSTDEPGFSAKSSRQTREKAAIARTAARLVEPGASVALSAGTTTYAVARALRDVAGLTVVTNSPPVAELLHDPARDDRTVVLTGGVRTPSDALVGPVADATLAGLRVDRTFLGVHGLDAQGLTTPNLAEAATDRALMACAAATTVIADHTKWGVVGLARIATLDDVDTLLTDDALPADARRHLTATTLVTVDTTGATP